jgi:hypothetical protein
VISGQIILPFYLIYTFFKSSAVKSFLVFDAGRLSRLSPPEKLEVLTIHGSYGENDDISRECGRWIGACKSLRQLEPYNLLIERLVLAKAMDNRELSLEALVLPDYADSSEAEDIEAFHEALAFQYNLRERAINADLFEDPNRHVASVMLL